MNARNQSLGAMKWGVLEVVLAANIPALLFVAFSPQAKAWLEQIFSTAAQYTK